MSARLANEMEAHARKLDGQASGFRMAGERALANTAHAASRALDAAREAMERHDARLGEARNAEKEA